MSTLFFVTDQPSKDRLIDALKYGDEPKVKFRIELTIRHHSSDRKVKIGDVEVTSYGRGDLPEPGWVTLTLRLHKDVQYLGHRYQAGIVNCTLDLSRRTEGTISLTRI